MRDNLSPGTCPEGDDRDTPIGGVSRLSLVPSVGDVPGLVVIDTPVSLEGDPGQEWAWEALGKTEPAHGIFPPARRFGGGSLPDTINSRASIDLEGVNTQHATHQLRGPKAHD